mgnify:CR=1 FL=1
MEVREKEALDIILPKFREMLGSMDRSQWFVVALPAIRAFIKTEHLQDKIHQNTIKKFLLKEIDLRSPPDFKEIEATLGIKVSRIEKNNELFTLHTPTGIVTIRGDDLMSQTEFRKKVMATLGIFLTAISKEEWDFTLSIWMSCLQRNNADLSTDELIKDALSQYLDDADERDRSYLRKAMPVFWEGEYCFRISDFVKFIKREFDSSLTRPQICAVLRDMGFEPDTNGKTRFWKINAEAYDQENNRTARNGEDDDADHRTPELGTAVGADSVRESDQRSDTGSQGSGDGEGGEREGASLLPNAALDEPNALEGQA